MLFGSRGLLWNRLMACELGVKVRPLVMLTLLVMAWRIPLAVVLSMWTMAELLLPYVIVMW